MSIKDFTEKIKSYWANFKYQNIDSDSHIKIKDDFYIVLIIILVGTASYGLGKISSFEKRNTPISIIKNDESLYASALTSQNNTNTINTVTKIEGLVLASRSGTKYYYPWCSGISKIKIENIVWFNTIIEAEAKGLTLAANCSSVK